MFGLISQEQHQQDTAGGVRYLFALGPFVFQDTLDVEGGMHHAVIETAAADEEQRFYRVDQRTMYEFMARFLAGEYEKEEYDLQQSPGHLALLDVLEMASASARSGETEFSLEELEDGDDGEEE